MQRLLRGVDDRIRTGDRLDHNQELYQLSYVHRAGQRTACRCQPSGSTPQSILQQGRSSGQLTKALCDPRPEIVGAGEGRLVLFGAGENFVSRRAGAETGVEVDQSRRTGARPTRHQGGPGQLVECGDVLARQLHVEHLRWVGDDVGGLADRRLDTGVRHPSLHRGEFLTAEEQPGRGLGIAGESLGVGDRGRVELDVPRALEIRHGANVPALEKLSIRDRATVTRMSRRHGIPFSRAALSSTALSGAQARGAVAIGALAVGAAAVGGFAIGRLSVGRLAIGRASIGKLKVEELEVGRLRIREGQPPV